MDKLKLLLPASKGVEREEGAEAVAEVGVILRQWVVPEKYQVRQDLRGHHTARQQQLRQSLCCTGPQLRTLSNKQFIHQAKQNVVN